MYPSFYVTDDYFICHHCQKKGDIFSLIGEFEKTDRWGALKILCHRAGINYTPSKQDEEKENVSRILKLFCEHFLIRDENSAPWKYLIDRGLTQGFIKQKLVGFIPEGSSFSSLPENLKQSKFIKEKKLPSWLAGRILLPFWQGHQIVYLTGRKLDKGKEKKYLNIYGEKPWCGSMRGPVLIVTEGPIDQLMAEQAGFNCIATAGSGGKIKIHKGIKKILLCFDGNEQGREFNEKYALDFYVPLCIDELTSKNMRNFQGLIYAISGGVSRGKASRNDPLDIVELRNFSTLVFSNGEPPMLSQNSFAGETVRVWELTGPPFGVDDENLINEIVSAIMENFGHAVEHFVINYLNLEDEFKNPESFLPPDKINSMSNAERRILKQLDVIYFTGLVINEIFKFDFPVMEDMEYIFKAIVKQIGEKVINIDNILSEIADYVSINHFAFPIVGKVLKKNTIEGTVSSHQKIFGFLFPNDNDGNDLGIIKSHFIDWMNAKWNSNTGGLYVFSILKEKGLVPNRCQKRIDEKVVDLVYLENFFDPEKPDNNGVEDESPF